MSDGTSSDSAPEYEVEEILDHKMKNGKMLYNIAWKSILINGQLEPQETTWEPETNLAGCKVMLRNYKEKHGLLRKSEKRRWDELKEQQKMEKKKDFVERTVLKNPEIFDTESSLGSLREPDNNSIDEMETNTASTSAGTAKSTPNRTFTVQKVPTTKPNTQQRQTQLIDPLHKPKRRGGGQSEPSSSGKKQLQAAESNIVGQTGGDERRGIQNAKRHLEARYSGGAAESASSGNKSDKNVSPKQVTAKKSRLSEPAKNCGKTSGDDTGRQSSDGSVPFSSASGSTKRRSDSDSRASRGLKKRIVHNASVDLDSLDGHSSDEEQSIDDSPVKTKDSDINNQRKSVEEVASDFFPSSMVLSLDNSPVQCAPLSSNQSSVASNIRALSSVRPPLPDFKVTNRVDCGVITDKCGDRVKLSQCIDDALKAVRDERKRLQGIRAVGVAERDTASNKFPFPIENFSVESLPEFTDHQRMSELHAQRIRLPGLTVNEKFESAVMMGNLDLVRELLDGSDSVVIDIDQTDSKGMTLLNICAFKPCGDDNDHCFCQIVALLISHGADVNYATVEGGYTPLMTATNMANLCVAFNLLTCNRINVNASNMNSDTALTLAVRRGNEEATKNLLSCGADFSHQNVYGQSPLSIVRSVGYGFPLVADRLLSLVERFTHDFLECIEQRISEQNIPYMLDRELLPVHYFSALESTLEVKFRFDKSQLLSNPTKSCVLFIGSGRIDEDENYREYLAFHNLKCDAFKSVLLNGTSLSVSSSDASFAFVKLDSALRQSALEENALTISVNVESFSKVSSCRVLAQMWLCNRSL